jgi:hypothetical protein
VIQGKIVVAMTISANSSVSNLSVDLAAGSGNAGLALAGHATAVTINGTASANPSNSIGVTLTNGATFQGGSVNLPLTGGDVDGFGGAVGSGTISDSNIVAAVGVGNDGPGGGYHSPNVVRDRIQANQGVVVGPGSSPEIEDSLITTVPGSQAEGGLTTASSATSGSFTARHLTVVGSGSAGSSGVSIAASGVAGPATSAALLDSSIVRGYATSVAAAATPGISTAAAVVTVNHSFYDPATTAIAATPPATAVIAPDAQSGNFDPLFVKASAADFHLQAGSPAIDAGGSALASGESTTDLEGNPRLVAGHSGDQPVSDVGAFEFRPAAPTVSASADAAGVSVGHPLGFHATPFVTAPGDVASVRWQFDDGAAATGNDVTHAFTTAGRHTATATATDLDGFTATGTVAVSVTAVPVTGRPPRISKLTITPRRFRATVGARVSYTDSRASTTTFRIRSLRSGRIVETFTRRDRAGVNAFHLSGRVRGRRLAAGAYRLEAVPRFGVRSGSRASVSFQVLRPGLGKRRHH